MSNTSEQMKEIMERIKSRRESLGLSFQQLADLTNMSKSTLQRYETGGIKNIPLDKLEILAKSLKTTPEWILGWNRNMDDIDKTVYSLYPGFVPNKNYISDFHSNNSQITNIEQQLKEYITSNSNVSWEKPMPIFKGVDFIDDSYKFKECIGYTYVGNIENFEQCICLEIPNNDFEPEFLQGDTALIHLQNKLENEKYFYIVIGNTPIIRKVMINDNKIVVLKADNPNIQLIFENQDNLKIIGKVIALKKTRDKKL